MIHNQLAVAVFHPKARDIIRDLPIEVREELGQLIYMLQLGEKLTMPHSRTLPAIAAKVSELRVRDRNGIYRVFYHLKSKKEVLIFHAFVKKTQAIPILEIQLARKRLKELLDG